MIGNNAYNKLNTDEGAIEIAKDTTPFTPPGSPKPTSYGANTDKAANEGTAIAVETAAPSSQNRGSWLRYPNGQLRFNRILTAAGSLLLAGLTLGLGIGLSRKGDGTPGTPQPTISPYPFPTFAPETGYHCNIATTVNITSPSSPFVVITGSPGVCNFTPILDAQVSNITYTDPNTTAVVGTYLFSKRILDGLTVERFCNLPCSVPSRDGAHTALEINSFTVDNGMLRILASIGNMNTYGGAGRGKSITISTNESGKVSYDEFSYTEVCPSKHEDARRQLYEEAIVRHKGTFVKPEELNNPEQRTSYHFNSIKDLEAEFNRLPKAAKLQTNQAIKKLNSEERAEKRSTASHNRVNQGTIFRGI